MASEVNYQWICEVCQRIYDMGGFEYTPVQFQPCEICGEPTRFYRVRPPSTFIPVIFKNETEKPWPIR